MPDLISMLCGAGIMLSFIGVGATLLVAVGDRDAWPLLGGMVSWVWWFPAHVIRQRKRRKALVAVERVPAPKIREGWPRTCDAR